jgi:hypothetical protein
MVPATARSENGVETFYSFLNTLTGSIVFNQIRKTPLTLLGVRGEVTGI